MISCVLVQVSRNDNGLPLRIETRIAGESIELGRGSACQIHLPDHRVDLLHATVKRAANGTLQIEATQGALISINGALERTAALAPGTRILIGPYRLEVGATSEDADIALTVDMPEAQTENPGTTPAAPLTLAALGISKRRLGLRLAAFILIALLALPMMSRVSPAFEAWQAGLPVKLTQWLSPGPVSVGHGLSGAKCSTCHQRALHAVADTVCTECHKRVGTHLVADSGDASALRDVRCANCHPAHQSKAETMKNGLSQCLDCHQRLGKAITDVRDFGSSHPDFQLAIPQGQETVRARQGAKEMPPEKSGLKFSHQVHLVPKGVSTPDGDTVLTCRSCHKLDASGNHFAPMAMRMTCQQSRCHKQRFAEPVRGIVPHGSEREVMSLLRNFYANWLADAPAEIAGKCGEEVKAGNSVKRTLACAELLSRKHAAASLFRETGEKLECVLCHEITETGKKDVPWKVAPVRLNHDWQPKAVFAHAKHDTVDCAECHDKTNSKSSEDVSFPDIAKCRTCHAGTSGVAGRVKSNCESCHQFHRVAEKPT
jgi:hypothetical protein